MIHAVELAGCAAEPLVAYLKALGVLRLVSEQVDADALGWWNGDTFVLESTLDTEGLVAFFLKRYAPTPILAPWNKGSGFYEGRADGLMAIARSNDSRFHDYREAIETVRGLTETGEFGQGGSKENLVVACRNSLGDRALEWVDAAVVTVSRSDLAYPAILGTGGNDGRLDYTNTFMSRVSELLIGTEEPSPSLIGNALFAAKAGGFIDSPAGQYDPGRAGGFNQGPGVEHKDVPTNPWNLVLSMEGGVAWAGSVGRRQGVAARKKACSPFTVDSRAVGYSSAAQRDEGSARAEIWTPLWNRASTYREIRLLLSEGKADIGRRAAGNGLEFAEAAASLGTDRGILAFVRYSILERRGKAYMALPAGRLCVREVRDVDLLRDIDEIQVQLDRFKRAASVGGQSPPREFTDGRHVLDNTIYDFVLRGDSTNLQRIVAALGRLEMYFSSRDPAREPKLERPLGGLRPSWLTACDDGSLEYRLAVALASIRESRDVGAIRANLAPVDPGKPWQWATGRGQKAWQGSGLCARLASVLQRRMMDAGRLNCPMNPVFGCIPLHPEDAASVCTGGVDETRIEELLFGLVLVRWGDGDRLKPCCQELRERWSKPVSEGTIPRVYALLKLLFLPRQLRLPSGVEVQVKPEPSLLPLLQANRIEEARAIAGRRLFSAGANPTRAHIADVDDGTRLAAALLVPVHSIEKLTGLVLHGEAS